MVEAPIFTDEADRMAALRSMNLLSTPAEAEFDRITQVAAEYFSLPISLFTLVDEDRQWFKSRFGLDAPETPRSVSFCGHAIAQKDVFVVENAHEDNRFANNPLVVGDPQVIFYAGVPIESPEGHRIGTFCIIDHSPRTFSQRERERLRDFGWWLQLALESRQLSRAQLKLIAELDLAKRESFIDPMTQCWNRRGFSELAKRETARCRRVGSGVALFMIDIDNFKLVNDAEGHSRGDQALISLARLLRCSMRPNDVIARLGGDEFAVLLPEITRAEALRRAESLQREVEQRSIDEDGPTFTISIGVKSVEKLAKDVTAESMIDFADKALFEAKQAGRNRVVESFWSESLSYHPL